MSSMVLSKSRLLLVAAMCAAILAFGMLVGADKAYAGAQPGASYIEDLSGTYVVSYKGASGDMGSRYYNSKKSDSAKITNVTSSNPNVATAEVNSFSFNGQNHYSMIINLKGTGTTKISYTFGGKKKTVNYTVKKYVNPVKSYKIGKNNYAKKFNPKALSYSNDYISVGVKSAMSGKVDLKLKKGWKIKKMWYWQGSDMHYFNNGNTISNATTVYAWITHGKQKEILYLHGGGQL